MLAAENKVPFDHHHHLACGNLIAWQYLRCSDHPITPTRRTTPNGRTPHVSTLHRKQSPFNLFYFYSAENYNYTSLLALF
jgi:hypothetical protein